MSIEASLGTEHMVCQFLAMTIINKCAIWVVGYCWGGILFKYHQLLPQFLGMWNLNAHKLEVDIGTLMMPLRSGDQQQKHCICLVVQGSGWLILQQCPIDVWPKEEGMKVELEQSRAKWSAVGDQDLCHIVLGGCSCSVFTVVNEGGEVSLYFLSNSEV